MFEVKNFDIVNWHLESTMIHRNGRKMYRKALEIFINILLATTSSINKNSKIMYKHTIRVFFFYNKVEGVHINARTTNIMKYDE